MTSPKIVKDILPLNNAVADIPASPGTYCILFRRLLGGSIKVGKLGRFNFPAGHYLYIGSALGPGGLAGRLRRHLSREKRLHWHVDFLDQESTVTELWVGFGTAKKEHSWASTIKRMPGANEPIIGFGSSDCQCSSHLFHFLEVPNFYQFCDNLSSQEQSSKGGKLLLIRL